MTRIYLYLNAALYLAFAIACTFAPDGTAASVGYLQLSPGGHSEYLVLYGGMEFGFAAFFTYCARRAAQVGVVFAVCLYLPIVLWRWPSVAAHWPVATTTLVTAALEVGLLAWGLLLLRRKPRSLFR